MTVKLVIGIIALALALIGLLSPALFELYYQHIERKYQEP